MATVPTPATQVAATEVPAATINSQGNLATYLAGRTESGGARKPLAVLRQTSPQSIANLSATAITLDAEDVDYDNGHSTVTNTSRYTAGTAGWYHCDYLIGYAANVTGTRGAGLRLNGTTTVPASTATVQACTTTGDGTGVGGSRMLFLNVGDYIELMATQDSGGALNTTTCSLCVEWRSV